jgi:hypothetical protein
MDNRTVSNNGLQYASRSIHARREDAESITDASFLPQVLVGFKHYAHQLGM